MKTTLIALTLMTLTGVAQAGMKTNDAIENYKYGTRLDIARVVSTPALDFCGVRPVQMTYIDHMGNSHTLRYEVTGNACLGDN